MKIHPDWPEFDDRSSTWDLPVPVDDLSYALEQRNMAVGQVASLTHYRVSHHSSPWVPGDTSGGSELEMEVVGRLHDGRWFALQAWNDYTGWGCQDGVERAVEDTEEDAVFGALDIGARRRFGYAERN